MIKDRNLAPGTRLVASYKKAAYVCEVVEAEGRKARIPPPGRRHDLQKPFSRGDGRHQAFLRRLDVLEPVDAGGKQEFPTLQNIFPGAPKEN